MIQNELSFSLIWSCDQTAGHAPSRVVISSAALCKEALGQGEMLCSPGRGRGTATCPDMQRSLTHENLQLQIKYRTQTLTKNTPHYVYTGFYRSTQTYKGFWKDGNHIGCARFFREVGCWLKLEVDVKGDQLHPEFIFMKRMYYFY